MTERKAGHPVILGVMRTTAVLLTVTALTMAFILIRHRVTGINAEKSESAGARNRVVSDNLYGSDSIIGGDVNNTESYDVKMNAEWTFRNGSTPSEDAYVENPVSNTNPVYFEVFVPGLKNTVYRSPVLKPGSHIENITFDSVLPSGKYNAVLKYSLLETDSETVTGSLQMALKITVQS